MWCLCYVERTFKVVPWHCFTVSLCWVFFGCFFCVCVILGFHQGCDWGLCQAMWLWSNLSFRGFGQLELCSAICHLRHRGKIASHGYTGNTKGREIMVTTIRSCKRNKALLCQRVSALVPLSKQPKATICLSFQPIKSICCHAWTKSCIFNQMVKFLNLFLNKVC